MSSQGRGPLAQTIQQHANRTAGSLVARQLQPLSASAAFLHGKDTALCDATAGAVLVTLPAGSPSIVGLPWTAFKTDGSANAAGLACSGADTFADGGTSLTTSVEGGMVSAMWDGEKWRQTVAGGADAAEALPASTLHLGGLLPFAGLRLVQAATTLAGGDNDIYTCPAGKRAIVRATGRIANTSVASRDVYGQLKIGGVYYRTSAAVTTASGAYSNASLLSSSGTFVLEAGQTWSVNASGAGVNYSAIILEYDAAVPCKSAAVLSLASGNNTLYTVPAGKMAAFAFNPLTIIGTGFVHNDTGGSITYNLHVVPDGDVADTSNIYDGGAVSAGTSAQRTLLVTAEDGTSIVLNASGPGGIAWLTLWELDAPP